MKDKAASDDFLVDGDDSDSAISDQGDEDPTPVEPVHTVEDLLTAPEPVPISIALYEQPTPGYTEYRTDVDISGTP